DAVVHDEAGLVDVGAFIRTVHAVHQASAQALELAFLHGVTNDHVGFGTVDLGNATVTHLMDDAGIQARDANGAKVETGAEQSHCVIGSNNQDVAVHTLGDQVGAVAEAMEDVVLGSFLVTHSHGVNGNGVVDQSTQQVVGVSSRALRKAIRVEVTQIGA